MRRIIEFITIMFMALATTLAFGQDEKIEPRVSISYFKHADDVPYLKILVRKRIERRYFPMPGQKVNAYFIEESDKNKMGEAITKDNGEALIEMPVSLMKGWHDNDSFDFIVTMAESDSTEEVNETLTITKAKLTVTADDDHNIQAKLEAIADSGWAVVPEVEVKFFIKRSFGRLPVTEDYLETDEEGTAEATFKKEIPGDAEGNITVGAWIEDHDEYGSVFAYTMKKWGKVTVDDNSAFEERTLWSTRDKTPYWLLVFPNLIILGVWGVIIYLVLQVLKIKRLSKS